MATIDAMNSVIQQIQDECKAQGFPICTWTEDGVDETDYIYNYEEGVGHHFWGKSFSYRVTDISKSGKTVKGRQYAKFPYTAYKEFSRMSIKKIIADCVNQRKMAHEHKLRENPV